jgi:hypothetical protein
MNRKMIRLGVAVVAAGSIVTAPVLAAIGDDDDLETVRTRLSGFNEDPLALSTTGNGRFRAEIDEQAQTISWKLSYADLEGTVTQAHLHLGGKAQSGGISVFLCSNLGDRPAGTQACPGSGTITGTISPVDVTGPAAQGISAGQFDELLAAVEHGVVYANVHSTLYPGGEIRGQLH